MVNDIFIIMIFPHHKTIQLSERTLIWGMAYWIKWAFQGSEKLHILG